MNKQLVAVPGHRDHPPQPVPTPVTEWRPVRRVGLLDRAALHIGVALVAWGRRPVKATRRSRPTVSSEVVDLQRSSDELREAHSLWGSDLTRIR